MPASIAGVVDPPASPRNANYTIDARLDTEAKRIVASATIVWRNVATRPADELRMHLYWNAWRDERSTFMRERAIAESGALPLDARGSIEITALSVRQLADVDLMAGRRFIAPDDGNVDDATVMAVALPSAVQPGETITLEIAWTAQVPRPVARTGFKGDVFFIAQWFPKIGVLEETGWNAHQFHAATEFFADYGTYDVTLTVPRGWTVGATGVARERTDEADGTTSHRYYQEDVHDFVWTTSPAYVERTAWFEPEPGTRVAAAGPVWLRLLLQPEHLGQEARHFEAARAALRFFGEWFGPYPYGHLTLVDPAYGSDVDGMEYPTLFTTGTSWLVPETPTYSTPEEVTIHEAGHQWWQGMVGSNEFEHAWIDEGITTWATGRVMAEAFPDSRLEQRFFGGFVPWVHHDVPLSRETYWNRRAGYRPNAESDDPSVPSFRYHPSSGYAVTYSKTALWLNTLERWLGWETVQRGLATLFARARFTHPGPAEVIAALSEAAGRDLSAFFDAVYRSSDEFDYGIERLRTADHEGRMRTTVVVRRYGEAIFPIDVAVTFADGSREVVAWDGRDRWRLLTFDKEARAVSAEVDPDRVLLLDVDFTNNSRTLAPEADAVATKWSLRWLIWLQDSMLNWVMLV